MFLLFKAAFKEQLMVRLDPDWLNGRSKKESTDA